MFKLFNPKPAPAVQNPTPPPPPATPAPSPPPQEPPDPTDRVYTQLYWKKRAQYLKSLEAWVRNELQIALNHERASNEPPSSPAHRRTDRGI